MTIRDFFKGDKFAALTGCEIVDCGPGRAKITMTVEEKHLNGGGTCQGGAIFTLADFAFAVCTNSHARLTVSVASSISFMHGPVLGDILTAEATEVVDHPKLPYCEVKVTDQKGVLVASFTGQAYRKNVDLPFNPE